MTNTKKAKQMYERRWGRIPSFSAFFESAKEVKQEINKEIVWLLSYRKSIEITQQPYGRGRKRELTQTIEDLRKLNDARSGISEKEAKKWRKLDRRMPRKIRVYWSDLTPEQSVFIRGRLRHKKGLFTTKQEAMFDYIEFGLRKEPKEDEIEQEIAVRANLEKEYEADKAKAERENRDFFSMEIAEGSDVPYGAYIGSEGDPTRRRWRKFGYEKTTPLGIEAKDARKRWLEEREIVYERGRALYGTIFFLVFLLGAMLYLYLTSLLKKGIQRGESSSIGRDTKGFGLK